jgi:hypothetical protein
MLNAAVYRWNWGHCDNLVGRTKRSTQAAIGNYNISGDEKLRGSSKTPEQDPSKLSVGALVKCEERGTKAAGCCFQIVPFPSNVRSIISSTMKKLPILVSASFICVLITGCMSEFSIAENEVPADLVSAFKTRYPAATGVRWEAEKEKGHFYYEAEWKENGKEVEVHISPDGTISAED